MVSTFTSLTNPEYNCFHCLKRYPRDKKRQDKHQERLGCDGSVDPKLEYRPTHSMEGYPKIRYSKCIGNLFCQTSLELINFHPRWERGEFMHEGGYFKQPAKFVEAMNLVHNLIDQQQKETEQRLSKYGKRSKS